MAIGDYLFISGQHDQAQLHYSFSERMAEPAPIEIHQPPKLRRRTVSEHVSPKYPPPVSVVAGVFHSGLSMFSNSFGCLPPSLEGIAVRGAGVRWDRACTPGEDTISLRKSLEAEILAH
jgi:hypothetical protein